MLYVSEPVGAEVAHMLLFAANILLHCSVKVSFKNPPKEYIFKNKIKGVLNVW